MINLVSRYNIPVVRQFEPQTDMKAFLEYVRDLEDLEGFVVRFNDGHMLKLKCHWYLQIHKAKEAILQDRNIVELILDEKLDDVKAHLPAEECDRLTQFEHDFNRAVQDVFNNTINTLYGLSVIVMDRKTFALEHAPSYDGYVRPILFKNFDFVPTQENIEKVKQDIYNTIRNNLTKTVKYEAMRDVWFKGLIFNDY